MEWSNGDAPGADPMNERSAMKERSVAPAPRTRRKTPTAAAAAPSEIIPLARSVGYHLRELSESMTAAMDREADASGITISQWRYLRELLEEDGLSSGELTRRVGRQGPTTVVAVQGLERAGLVTVTKSEHDRRKSYVHLTERGRTLAASIPPLVRKVTDMALFGLTAGEVRQFKRLMIRMQRNLDATARSRNSWAVWRTELLAQEVEV
jgi:DNA-binding MarR family transcriptional regulator